MTIERRVVANVCDILRLHLVCGKCQAAISYAVEQVRQPVASQCPNCHHPWLPRERQYLVDAVEQLFSAVRDLRALDANALRIDLDFGPLPPTA